MGTISPGSGLPLFSVGCSCLSRRQPQEPNTRWGVGVGGQGINDADRPTPAPRKQAGGREGGEGAGLQPQNPSQASGAQALARQFCKSTTLLAKIPAMSPGDTEVRPSEGGVPEVFEEWFGPARVPLLT